MKIELDIPISEESLDESSKLRLRYDALEAAVLRLFAERRITSAKATADLGLTRIQFTELTRKRGISQYGGTSEGIAVEITNSEKIEGHLPDCTDTIQPIEMVWTHRSQPDRGILERARSAASALKYAPSIEEVRSALASIPGSLAADVIAERGDY